MCEEDELEHGFAGNVFCSCASSKIDEWLLNIGAMDHITQVFNDLMSLVNCKMSSHINLSCDNVALITNSEFVFLANDLKLHNVLCVPKFKFKLLSVSKLMHDNNCFVSFYPKFSLIQDFATKG